MAWAAALLALLLTTDAAWARRDSRYGINVRYEQSSMDKVDEALRQSAAQMLDRLAARLRDEFPCSLVLDPAAVRGALGQIRQQALAGAQTDSLGDLGLALGAAPHVVALRVTPDAGGRSLSVKIWGAHVRRARGHSLVAGSVATPADAQALIGRFIEQLAMQQVCPYTGTVTLEQHSERSQREDERRAVYCNGADGVYRLQRVFSQELRQAWTLDKFGPSAAAGRVALDGTETEELTEEDACHVCASGRQAGRTAVRHSVSRSVVRSTPVPPGTSGPERVGNATVTLEFEDGGRYYVVLNAASDIGRRETTVRSSAQGSCDNQAPSRKHTQTDISVPIDALRLGPFAGTAMDKRLWGNLRMPMDDPLIGEKGERVIHFELRRD